VIFGEQTSPWGLGALTALLAIAPFALWYRYRIDQRLGLYRAAPWIKWVTFASMAFIAVLAMRGLVELCVAVVR
jgi:hypothetical protein